MKNKINLFIVIYISFFFKYVFCNDLYQNIQPETASEKKSEVNLKFGKFKNFVVVTANDYATKIGYDILERGGTVADAAVAIQLTLGLVEPQSSGLGGGLFITQYNKSNNTKISFEGRERAPNNLKKDIFLKKNGEPKKFFDAVIGGASVGVPATLKTLFKMHKSYGKLEWEEVIKPVIELSLNGFIPPNRLINAIKKEKFLFDIYPESIFRRIVSNPEKLFLNYDYTKTLKVISKDFSSFYEKEIAKEIVQTVNESINPGSLTLEDLINYEVEENKALCFKLQNNYEICGPNLPSSGTICIIQGLILFEDLFVNKSDFTTNLKLDLNEILEILNFIYYSRDLHLADPDFINIDIKKLLDRDYLIEKYRNFKKSKTFSEIRNFEEIFSSTSHFSLVDKYNNVLSATSSIESSFGSRLFTNGFFLNNQLTDFSFRTNDSSGKPLKNHPDSKKRPLSSMSPLIILDENGKFLLSIGSPGGKAIISYVFKSLISLIYMNKSINYAIESPNYIKIKDKIFVEDGVLNQELRKKGFERNLTSGLAIIKKENNYFSAAADSRRDGTVRGN